MACLIVAARAWCDPRAARARLRHVQADDQLAQLSPQPSVIFRGRLTLEALQCVFEFVQNRLQEFAQRLGLIRGTPSGAWSGPFRAPVRGGVTVGSSRSTPRVTGRDAWAAWPHGLTPLIRGEKRNHVENRTAPWAQRSRSVRARTSLPAGTWPP